MAIKLVGKETVTPAHPADVLGHMLIQQLEQLNEQVASLVSREQISLLQVGVGSSQRRERIMNDWPVTGGKRVIVPSDRAYGATVPLAAATATKICENKESRIGGAITNKGANGVTLYLGNLEEYPAMARPLIWLPGVSATLASSNIWNFLLSNAVWTGSVVAIADTGGTTIVTAEV